MQLHQFVKQNFKVLDSKTTLQILTQNFRLKNFPNGKKIFLCVGPKGSGKSTVIANLYQHNVLDLPYISGDAFLQVQNPKFQNPHLAQKASMLVTENLVKCGSSFCLESELADPKNFEILSQAKKNGYKISVFYVMTDMPNINLSRMTNANARELTEMIEEHNSFKPRVVKLIEICDELYMYDNSKNLTQTNDNDMLLE